MTLKAGMPAAPIVLPGVDGSERKIEPATVGAAAFVFYKIDCPTCQFAMPYFDRLYRAFADHQVPVLAVAQNDAAQAAEFAARYGLAMPQLIDAAGYAASKAYGVMTVPSLFVTGADGTLTLASAGFVRDDVQRAAALLALSLGGPAPTIFAAGEDVPALKPG